MHAWAHQGPNKVHIWQARRGPSSSRVLLDVSCHGATVTDAAKTCLITAHQVMALPKYTGLWFCHPLAASITGPRDTVWCQSPWLLSHIRHPAGGKAEGVTSSEQQPLLANASFVRDSETPPVNASSTGGVSGKGQRFSFSNKVAPVRLKGS